MTQDETTPSIAAFDLDQDSVPDIVAVDTNADGTADVAAFDLDEDSVPDVVAVDTNADGTADVAAFDLDEDGVLDATDTDTDADSDADEGTGFDLESDSTEEEYGDEYEDEGRTQEELAEDSLTTPPEDITDEDLGDAASDLQHTQLMGQYMQSRGVIG